MSSPVVSSIIQDHEGYLWFGTYSGLDKYDGYNFKSYKHDPNDSTTLNNGYIQTLFEDKSANIWVGTSEGLDKFDRTTGKFFHYFPFGKNIKKDGINHVLSICEDKEGVFWVGTGDGLFILDRSTGTFFHYIHNDKDNGSIVHNTVNSIMENRSGSLWFATGNGLDKFDRRSNKFIHYWYDPEDLDEWDSYWINAIFEDKSGVLWLGTRRGLVEFNQSDSTFITYGEKFGGISSICEDESGLLWLGNWTECLFSFDKLKKTFTSYWNDSRDPESLSHNQVTSVCFERSGTTWIGTWGGGVNKLDNHRVLFSRYKHIEGKSESLYSNDIYCISQGGENDILLISEDVVEKFDPKTEKFNRLITKEKEIDQILQDTDNHFWVSARTGLSLYKYDQKNTVTKVYSVSEAPHPSWSMFKSRDGILWIEDAGVLYSIDYKSKKSDRLELGNSHGVKKYFEDKSGLLWIGSGGGGLFCYDRLNKKITHYISETTKNSLSSNTVFAIYEDKKGNLWIGTSNGLDLFDRITNTFTNFNGNNGLINNQVYTIFEDHFGNLWMSTAKGIAKFDTESKKFKNYPLPYRLNAIWFWQPPGMMANNGEIYLGGGNGLIRFNPDSIKDNLYIPPIVITDFRKFDKSFPVEKEIYLNFDDNYLSFEFAALNYLNPERNEYAYKMEGLDNDWIYSGTRRYASYPNLEPGEYVFKVKGSNNDGIWNEEGTSIAIIISPPWWKTWWAYSTYALLFILSLYGIRRYELNRAGLMNKIKMDEVVLREKEETDKMKSRFFANISHEFRTPLTLILGPAEKILADDSEDIKKDVSIIKRNSKRLLQLINQLLDLSKLEAGKLKLEASKGNIVSFVKGAALSFESLAESKDISLKINSDKEFIEMYFDKEKMLKILTNILSNAFKFTPEEGEITVSIGQRHYFSHAEPVSASQEIPKRVRDDNMKGFVEIKIKDTGIGIAKEEIPKLFDRFYQVDSSHTREYEGTGIGLALTKELIGLHHGSIKVESEKDSWTEFTLQFPLGKDHLSNKEISAETETKTSIILNPDEVGMKNLKEEPVNQINKVNSASHFDKLSVTNDNQKNKGTEEDKTIILVVEDNYDMRQYIRESLDGNYLIEEAVNGEQGVRKAEKIIPDLIISDMMMPKMDGNQLVKILKNDEKTSHIPIILLTAKAGQENKLEGLEIGADDYLTKPFDIKELQVRIKNLISIRKKLQERFNKIENQFPVVKGLKLNSLDEKFILNVNEVIEKHISEEGFSIEEFAKEVGMSKSQFHRKFTAITGKPASMYLRSVRLSSAKKMIEGKTGNISEIAFSVGFSSLSYFSKCFKEEFGYPPSDLT
jgi:signal transduction histidine kinase/ligand-binding sensor domain-containing protein/DNA-binding response OmpR family regulator